MVSIVFKRTNVFKLVLLVNVLLCKAFNACIHINSRKGRSISLLSLSKSLLKQPDEIRNDSSIIEEKRTTRRKPRQSKNIPERTNENDCVDHEARSFVDCTPEPLKSGVAFWKNDSEAITIYQEPSIVSCDSFIDESVNKRSDLSHGTEKKKLQFQVHGNPLSLRRHRTSRGFMYNPSAADQRVFRDVVTSMLPHHLIPTDPDTLLNNETVLNPVHPFFQSNEHLMIQLIFYMKRPKSHFVGSNPHKGRIRENYQGLLPHRSKTDVDNLAKFVLDSLNGLLYVDDRQVMSLHVTKLLHSDGDYMGLTKVSIESIHEGQVKNLLLSL